MRRSFIACLLALVACISGLVVAEERPDQQIFWKIRQEGTNNSQIRGRCTCSRMCTARG